ncbi:MAG: YetF domain-containing protein [Alteraurantiacibacter sp.]
MWFDTWPDIGNIALTTFVIYAALIAILQIVGKRSIAKLNIFDLVVTVALGSILASVMLTKSLSIADGLAAFLVLAFLQWIVSFLSVRFGWFKQVIRSDSRVLLKDGQFLEKEMKAERVTHGEIEAAIRGKGHGKIESIAAVVLESDGSFSVIEGPPASQYSALERMLKNDDKSESGGA